MNNKERLEMILRGEIPDTPPHFELVFQIEKEYFGMNPPQPEDRNGNLQYNLGLQTKLVDAGADLFILAHDFGFNEGPFVSPEQFGEFIVSYFTEIVDYIHRDLKLKAILHSDGDLRLILDQIYQTGIDGYQSVDPQGHMDIKEVREQYPEWILMGNVKSSMLQDTVEKDIRESVRYCMKYGGMGKPYIFSTSNCIFKGMPNKSYDIMLDEYNKIISSGDEL